MLRCGTSIVANVNEGGAAQTKRDFATKMAIASKKARETHYWLSLLDQRKLVNMNYAIPLDKISEIIRLLTAIVKTTQSHL